MKLIETSKLVFITLECYSSSEDISDTFQYALQIYETERIDDKRILREIEKIHFDYDYDEITIKVVERNINGKFEEREIKYE